MRSLLAGVVAAAALALPASAAAAPVIGMGDQRPTMFTDPAWLDLDLRHVRIVVSWDVFRYRDKTAQLDVWMQAARASGRKPLVAWERSWTPGQERKAPSRSQFRALVRTFRSKYPWVRDYSAWNEANYQLQPTARKPQLAAMYWREMRRLCRGCTVTSPVYLDLKGSSSKRWLRAFRKHTNGRVRLWAVHVYGDINRRTDRNMRKLFRGLPGKIWVTETAGWVAFGKWAHDEQRAAAAITYNFKVIRKYRRKVTRWYFYQWRGTPGHRWDSGLVGPNGEHRASLDAFNAGLLGLRRR